MRRLHGTHLVLALGLATVLCLAATSVRGASPPVAAGHGPVPADLAQQARRTIVWLWSGPSSSPPHSFKINSQSVNAPTPDEFQVAYQDGAFSLDYERRAGGPITSSFALSVKGLVEWTDLNGDGRVDEHAIVAATPLGTTGFGEIPIQHSQITTSDGFEVHSWIVRSNTGAVTLNLTLSQGFVALAPSQTLTPMEAKLTLEINHVMTRSDTRLALQLGMRTGQNVAFENRSWDDENRFSHDEHAVNVTNASASEPSSAYFAWSSSATVNGQVGGVVNTGPEVNETVGGYDLYLAYPRGFSFANPFEQHIVHDPTIGVVSAAYQSILRTGSGSSPIQGDYLLYLVTMAAVAALVAGTAMRARRRRQP